MVIYNCVERVSAGRAVCSILGPKNTELANAA